jgi:uncharacterized membrane protein YdjX (TVP38/TMEM64 family)
VFFFKKCGFQVKKQVLHILVTHKKIVALIALALCCIIALSLVINSFFSLSTLQDYRETITAFIHRHYALSVTLFVLIYILDNILALPIATALAMSAGFFFGFLPAIVIVLASLAVGATVSFSLSRYFWGTKIQEKYKTDLQRFNAVFDHYGTYYLLAVRLVPIIPFVLVNIVAGLTLVSYPRFLWTTVIGMIPLTILQTLWGDQFQNVRSTWDLLTWQMMLVFCVLLLLALLPILFRRHGMLK